MKHIQVTTAYRQTAAANVWLTDRLDPFDRRRCRVWENLNRAELDAGFIVWGSPASLGERRVLAQSGTVNRTSGLDDS